MRLLLVDDSSVMRKLVSRSLRQFGIEVAETHEAGNGAEALALLEHTEVDLIILDWNMPVLNGVEFLAQVRFKNAEIPVVMLTTESGDEQIRQAMVAGATAYVTKPFTPERLGTTISVVMDA